MISNKYLTNLEIDSIVLNINQEYHIVKHLSKLSFYYKVYFYINGFSFKNILNQLNAPGSKFHSNFVSSPKYLLNLIKTKIKKTNVEYIWKNKRCEISLEFSKKKYPKGIGFDALIPIKDIPKNELKKLTKHKLSDKTQYIAPTIILKNQKNTWIATIILQKNNHDISVLTIFPGIIAPPLPDATKQTKENFDKLSKFWSNHALIHKQ